MAILIVEHNGTVEGASLNGRVLIGRRPSNHVVVDHPDVSRIHAWIDTAGRQVCLTDAGSRTGTFVNGHRVAAKVPLKHGDRITLGPAALTFRADASLPAGVSAAAFAPRGPDADGLLFDCTCGAPLWVPSAFAGKTGTCRFCNALVAVPGGSAAVPAAAKRVAALPANPTYAASPSTAAPAAPAAPRPASAAVETPITVATAATDTCGACQSTIAVGEHLTTCPACGLTFHADCWAENFGCSAYGCSQANVLLPKTPLAKADAPGDTAADPAAVDGIADAQPDDDAVPDPRADGDGGVPREYLLLAASLAGLLAGAFTFGVPALLALVAAAVYLKRAGARDNRDAGVGHRGAGHRGVAWAAILLAVVGVGAGVVISYVWWLGGPSGAAS
jgi:hypothetical protein